MEKWHSPEFAIISSLVTLFFMEAGISILKMMLPHGQAFMQEPDSGNKYLNVNSLRGLTWFCYEALLGSDNVCPHPLEIHMDLTCVS